MIEFLSIGAHAVARGGVGPGDTALIIGAGPIGIGTGIFAQNSGADVVFLDLNSQRAETAAAIVPSSIGYALDDNIFETLDKHTEGDLFDVVFDATGNATSMHAAFNYVSHGGRCVFVSVVDADITFNDPHFHAREITLLGSRNARRADFERVIAAMKSGDVPVDELNTHNCDLIDVPKAIPDWLNQQDSLIKGVVHIE
jgi:threonine dehydrogenase-like Zn-dependent dehydrogenase